MELCTQSIPSQFYECFIKQLINNCFANEFTAFTKIPRAVNFIISDLLNITKAIWERWAAFKIMHFLQ